MTLQPSIIALLLLSLLTTAMVLYAAYYGALIFRKWDRRSGSELQLHLERRTYLISTTLSYVFVFQIVSLFLFVFTADSLNSLFVGAMCAAGTLNVNSYGYPALVLKILNFFLAGSWLIINYTDNKAYDYPLIKKKYLLLIAIAPFITADLIVLWKYFTGLRADVITSCCGSLFSSEQKSLGSELASLPAGPMKTVFFSGLALTTLLGVYFYRTERLGYPFSAASTATFVIMGLSVISFISLYCYELPTHHCPFCILQQDYGHVGYILYISLFTGAVSGTGVGALMPFRSVQSLSKAAPLIQKRLTLVTLVSYGIFAATAVYQMIFSGLTLSGY